MKINLSIVIVLYKEQPPKYVGSGIEDNIILVDNTPERDLQINLPNVKYIPLKKNYGIAKALNVAFSTVNRWESGKTRPNLTAMKQIKLFCEKNNIPFDSLENVWLCQSKGE